VLFSIEPPHQGLILVEVPSLFVPPPPSSTCRTMRQGFLLSGLSTAILNVFWFSSLRVSPRSSLKLRSLSSRGSENFFSLTFAPLIIVDVVHVKTSPLQVGSGFQSSVEAQLFKGDEQARIVPILLRTIPLP